MSDAHTAEAPRVLPGFFTAALAGGWRDLPFEPFREGVEIHRLADGPAAAALLRYAPGASVPRHRHTGLETILVLTGSTTIEDVERYPFRPSRVLPSIAEAIELI